MEEQKKKLDANTIIIVAAIVLAALIIGGSVWMNKNNRGTPNQSPSGQISKGLEVGESPVLGDPNAPHTIVEFLDFQCPYCERFSGTIESQLRELFIETGKAKLVYKALTFIDSYDENKDPMESLLAAQAGECAKEQGKYIAMHDAIYEQEFVESEAGKSPENSGNLTEQFFASTAAMIGLDVGAFNECIASDRIADLLEVYMNDAQSAMGGKVSTPTVFVDGTKITNPFDLQEYEKLIK